jgi:glucan phosphoethanolaminetransferase (alkaline phosphatase superfamily)
MMGFALFFANKNSDKMIQRIQTIFLFLVVVAMGVTIGTPLWDQMDTGSGTGDSWNLTAFMLTNLDSTGEVIQSSSKWYIAAMASFAGLLALISIFQYKVRSRQMMLNMINSLIMVGLVATVFLTTNGINQEIAAEVAGAYQPGFWAVLVAMVCNMLANRFIRKDEALVRSVDRIR